MPSNSFCSVGAERMRGTQRGNPRRIGADRECVCDFESTKVDETVSIFFVLRDLDDFESRLRARPIAYVARISIFISSILIRAFPYDV